MSARKVHFIQLGLALFLLGMTLWLAGIFPAKQQGLPNGFTTPILLFEFAQNQEHLAPFSGMSESAKILRRQSFEGHPVDNIFCFGYGLFGASLFWLFLKRRRFAWLGVAFAIIAIFGDINENRVLVNITQLLEDQQSALALLPELKVATWIKWGAIGLFQAILGVCFLLEKPRFLALFCFAPGLLLSVAFLAGQPGFWVEKASTAVALFFLIFFVFTVYKCIDPALRLKNWFNRPKRWSSW